MTAMIVSPNGLHISDQWIMVTKGYYRIFILKGGGDLKPKMINSSIRLIELTPLSTKLEKRITNTNCNAIRSEDEAVCRSILGVAFWSLSSEVRRIFQPDQRAFIILGRHVGNCNIGFFKNKNKVIQLTIEVMNPISIPVAFHLIHHLKDGRTPHISHAKRVREAELLSALERTNHILRQGGIKFTFHAFHMTKVDIDLGTAVMAKSTKDKEVIAIRKLRDVSVVTNVFFFDKIINNGGTSGTTFEKSDVFVEVSPVLKGFHLLAHELSHVLGLEHFWLPFEKTKPISTQGNIITYAPQPLTHNLMDGNGEKDWGLRRNQIYSMRNRARTLATGKK